MAKVLIGKIVPQKGTDYMTREDIKELGNYFAPVGYVSGTYTVDTVGGLDDILSEIYSAMAEDTQEIIRVNMDVEDGLIDRNWFITIRKCDNDIGHMEAVTHSTDGGSPIVCRRSVFDGFGEWAYENPPLDVGVEYMTAQLWRGKPVYTKLVDLGELPGYGESTVEFAQAGVVQWIISVQAQGEDGATFPSYYEDMDIELSTSATADTAAKISIRTNEEYIAGIQVYALVKYTKY